MDKDGRLNTTEKSNALAAIHNGLENKFVWNIDKSGPSNQNRILQKRGVVVEADNFGVVGKTYPGLEMSKSAPKIKTSRELKNVRKKDIQETMKQTKNEWDKLNPSTVHQKYILSEYLIDQPTHSSVQQIKEENLQKARESCGLNAISSEINNNPSSIGAKYVENQKYKCKSEMNQNKKDQNVRF